MKYAKAIVAGLGSVLTVLSQVALPHPYDNYVSLALLVLTTAGVYHVPNKTQESTASGS